MLRRPRRNRSHEAIRSAIRETHLFPANLVMPLFLLPGEDEKSTIPSLPMVERMSGNIMSEFIGRGLEEGISKYMIFPAVPDDLKDKEATYGSRKDNFYLKEVARLKQQYPDAIFISDVAMDPYSSDGHDGYVEDGKILNDRTLPILSNMAVAQAQAGFDVIGPSDMMDGRVKHIRESLDREGYTDVSIMAYTAKYASSFYGPFRDALDSAPKSGDKKSYQMDPANTREAMIEAALDIEEGADMIMVKPAIHYLDVIHRLHMNYEIPIAAYHVSGECAMLWAACKNGWLDYDKAMPETLLSIKRAGASFIMSYFALDFARFYNQKPLML